MNWLDYVFLGILALSVIVSLFRGLVREVLSLLIWITAFWVAYHFVNVGADALDQWIELPSARHLISFVGLFMIALSIGGMVNYIVGKLIKKTGLTGTDRFFGLFFGAIRGLIAIVAITFFIKATPLSEDPWWQESKLVPHFSKMSEWVRSNMPEKFAGYFSFIEQSKVDEMQNLVDKLIQQNSDDQRQQPSKDSTTQQTKPINNQEQEKP